MTGPGDPAAAASAVATVYVRARPETVWRALTDPAMTVHFHGGVFDADWVPGAPLRFLDAGVLSVEGTVLEVDPPRRLVHSFRAHWTADTLTDPVSRVSWEIEEVKPGICRVTLVHDRLVEGSATSRIVAKGIPRILSGLKTLLETGEPLGVLDG